MTSIKPRWEVAAFIQKQLSSPYDEPRPKGRQFHYGKQELRTLLDFIYGEPPNTENEQLD